MNRLRDADIPMLWKPLHEASSGWFWWGAKGAEAYKQLWYYLYNQFTYVYSLKTCMIIQKSYRFLETLFFYYSCSIIILFSIVRSNTSMI